MLPSWYTLTAGPVPEGIVNLTELIELDLSFNRLSGMCHSLSLFTQTATYSRTIPLPYLDTGAIPDGIVNLAHLIEVNLIDTYLSGQCLVVVLHCTSYK
jgi:hypothetical protein